MLRSSPDSSRVSAGTSTGGIASVAVEAGASTYAVSVLGSSTDIIACSVLERRVDSSAIAAAADGVQIEVRSKVMTQLQKLSGVH